MSDALSSVELTEYQVELLPARTALSLFVQGLGGGSGKGGSLLDILKGLIPKGLIPGT